MGSADVVAALKAFSTYKPADAFSPPFDERPFVGRRIRVSGPVHDGNQLGAPFGLGYWTYDSRSQEFKVAALRMPVSTLSLITEDVALYRRLKLVTSLVIEGSRREGKPYAASNAYGASATVTPLHVEKYGIAEFSGEYSTQLVDGVRDTDLRYVAALPPETARRLSTAARIVVDARVVPFDNGRVLFCADDYDGPTVSKPRELISKECVLSVKVERVAITDGEGGPVLAEWK